MRPASVVFERHAEDMEASPESMAVPKKEAKVDMIQVEFFRGSAIPQKEAISVIRKSAQANRKPAVPKFY